MESRFLRFSNRKFDVTTSNFIFSFPTAAVFGAAGAGPVGAVGCVGAVGAFRRKIAKTSMSKQLNK